jgi:nicotinate-nucleotide pyrophosphorylase (carboxylating)
MSDKYIYDFIKYALAEDIGDGDHSSLACIPKKKKGKSQLIIKDDGVLAGIDIGQKIFQAIDPKTNVDIQIIDGQAIKKGDIALTVEGKIQSLLMAERIVLNVMQRMSGIATSTNQYAEKIKDLKTQILDTRKTTPGFRYFEKKAVELGGGVNHRMGLYDMIMLKDNHIDFAGGIEKAIRKVHKYLEKNQKMLKIEVEARSLDEVKEIIGVGGVDRIMLDNFSLEETREAVKLINGQFETESSGGITHETIRDYAECGVDFVSVGALTHQIKSLDMSLKAI